MAELVHYATANGVATITLDSPHNRNALSAQLRRELRDHLATAAGDDAVRVVVLDHTGPVFCAGMDLKEAGSTGSATDGVNEFPEILTQIWTSRKPVVAKLAGPARAGGVGLVAAADIAVASDDAKIGFTEARLGILPAVISPYVVMKLGAGQARRWFVTGSRMDAREALAIGLVHRVVPRADLEKAAHEMAFEVLQCAPGAVAACKELVEDVVGGLALASSLEDGFADVKSYTAQRIAQARVSAEGQEGMKAFLEKRKPRWAQ